MTRTEYDEEMNDWPDLISFCNDNGLEDRVDDIVDTEYLDEMVKSEAEGGWQRVFFFLHNINYMNADYFRLDGYGNVADLSSDDFKTYKDDIATDATFDEEEPEEDDDIDEFERNRAEDEEKGRKASDGTFPVI